MSSDFTHGYALLIGIGATVYPKWSLPVTVKDMKAIRAILTNVNLCAYPSDDNHIRTLCNNEATGQAILDGLTWLKAQAMQESEAMSRA